MLAKALTYAPPSAIGRAAISFVLLVGFYLLLLGIAVALLLLPVAACVISRGFEPRLLLLLFALCWPSAGLLALSVLKAKRPVFVPPARRLERAEAPALFELVEELAVRAGTKAPSDVYLAPLPNLSVTETGGVFGARRVLTIGAPILFFLSIDELRAGIAHELGHFIGGDTRLNGFSRQTHALFASVIASVEPRPFRERMHYAIEAGLAIAQALGRGLVTVYGRLFLLVTLRFGRRQELAADALAVSLVSRQATASALRTISVAIPLYVLYVEREVGFAIRNGAMPTDLAAGFERFRARFSRSEEGRELLHRIENEVTDPSDTHPALADRLRALDAQADGGAERDLRPATSLLTNVPEFEQWLVQATRERVVVAFVNQDVKIGVVQELPWAKIHDEVYAESVRETARRMAERLYPLFPNAKTLGRMFAAVWQQLDAGGAMAIASKLEPNIERLNPADAQRYVFNVCASALVSLLQGALFERGATVEDSIGEAMLILRLGDERVDAGAAIRLLGTDNAAARQLLYRWAEQFEAA